MDVRQLRAGVGMPKSLLLSITVFHYLRRVMRSCGVGAYDEIEHFPSLVRSENEVCVPASTVGIVVMFWGSEYCVLFTANSNQGVK